MASNFLDFLKLLLWKNFLIKFRHKKEFIIEIILPLGFCSLLVLFRNLSELHHFNTPKTYPPIKINKWSYMQSYKIAYTPASEVYKNLVTDAVSTFKASTIGFENGKDMELYMLANNKTLCGVVFETANEPTTDLPAKFAYRLRFPPGSYYNWMTGSLYSGSLQQGPRDEAWNDGGYSPGYLSNGFIGMQQAISQSFIKMAAKNNGKNVDNIPEIMMERFPYPPYTSDRLLGFLEIIGALLIFASFAYPVNQTVKYVTSEKENQLKEIMNIMGLTTAHHWTAWFLTIFICTATIVIGIVCLLKLPIAANGAVLIYSSWSVLFVFLLLYAAAMITFCFMISSFFSKASVAGSLAGVIWFLFYVPYSITISNFMNMGQFSRMLFSLFLNTAMPFGFKTIISWEMLSVGAQWGNLFNASNLTGSLSMGQAMIMLLVDTVLYMQIALYVEKVMPGSYGVPEKWYFPVSKEFWFPKKSTYFEDPSQRISKLDHNRFELDQSYARRQVGIYLRNLTKQFDGKVAVDNFDLDMYEDDITVLLGHNGAGKTTTISMITGFLAATKGTIIINGIDISKNIAEVRKNLGVCPQHNILFDELTVAEHIIFYSRLKGLTKHQIESEITKYLEILNLEDKRDAQSKTLSGGMKRKLSLGVALCGESKVVLCDEPSSGMDPQARRAVWDLLESEKKGRTILLTTHYMDEADVLGDRIAIMSHGKLTCCGSSFFLKKKFGTGYQLICNKSTKCQKDKVTALLRKYIPEIQVKTDVGTELSYSLSENHAPIFEKLLKDLEDSQFQLGLNGYGISTTTLEDVFMRTGSELHNVGTETEENSDNHSGVLIDTNNSKEIVSHVKRRCYQWRAMFLKKFYYSIGNWYMSVLQLLIVIFLMAICLYSSKSADSAVTDLPSLKITLDSYGDTTTLLSAPKELNTSPIAQSYVDMFKNMPAADHLVTNDKNIQDEILALGNKPLQFNAGTKYLVAATIQPGQMIAWFNNEAYHTPPLAINLVQNAIAKSILGSDYSISVTNDPLPYDAAHKSNEANNSFGIGFSLALNMGFAMAFASAIFVLFIIKERQSRSKLLQFVSGVSALIFWSVHLLFDMLTYIAIAISVVVLMLIFQLGGFRTAEQLGLVFLIFILLGFAALPFTYLLAFMFSHPPTGLSRLSIFNIIAGPVLYIVIDVAKRAVVENEPAVYISEGILLLFPNFAFSQALGNYGTFASSIGSCRKLTTDYNMTMNQVCAQLMQKCCDLKIFGWKSPGIGKVVVYLLGTAVAYFLLLLIIENFCKNLNILSRIYRPALSTPIDVDDDVQAEKDRVSNMSYQDIGNRTLIMRGLTKCYKKFLAVNQLSLAIEHGECFGLLGVNGAGKTSTFQMLTGDEHISYGDVWIEGNNTKKKLSKIYEMIGYCPQFDALLLDLTGRETLKMFSLIRGIPIHIIDSLTIRLGKDLAFEKHLNKKVSAYSGGNRRKLSTAVALLGNPEIVYLDEPTTGIDPASRRKLWDMICYVRDLGKGIILTSHSMEECEALCTRIAIMVNGEFKCLGSTQHLKNKFSRGLSLIIKMKKAENFEKSLSVDARTPLVFISGDDVLMDKCEKEVFDFIMAKFPGAVLKDNRPRLLTFNIPLNVMPYSKIFGLMETNRHELKIEDYSLTQASLEEIFLQFAKQQRIDDKTKKKK